MKIRFNSLMPGFVRRAKQIRSERARLSAIAPIPCDAIRLQDLKELAPESILGSPDCVTVWRETQPLLDRFPIIDGRGGVNPGDRRAIFALIHALRPASVLEIGTHIGASTLHIAAALSLLEKSTGHAPRLVSVDIADVNDMSKKPWEKYGSRFSPAQMMAATGYDRFVRFIAADSIDYLASAKDRYDFIFLDGNHAATAVYREVPAALQLLNAGGVILLHDYFPRLKPLWRNGSLIAGPALAIERLRNEGAKIRAVPLGDLPWPTKEGSNTTSLALLLKDA